MTTKQLEQIEAYVKKSMVNSLEPQHTFEHLERVMSNALRIVSLLNFKNDIDINLLKAMCLLHDLTWIRNRWNIVNYFLEGNLVKKILIEDLPQFELERTDELLILNSVPRHTFSIPFKRLNKNRDVYTKILQDADSIDYFGIERQASFNENKSKYFYYRVGSLISDRFFVYGRKNLGQYLNFPELEKHNWFDNVAKFDMPQEVVSVQQ